MDNQLWSWVLGLVGVGGFILAGKKIWWAWYINIAAQFLWTAYALITEQYGFLVSAAVYFWVFSKNAYDWTKEYLDKKPDESEDDTQHRPKIIARQEKLHKKIPSESFMKSLGVEGVIHLSKTDMDVINYISSFLEVRSENEGTKVDVFWQKHGSGQSSIIWRLPSMTCRFGGVLTNACTDPGACGCYVMRSKTVHEF